MMLNSVTIEGTLERAPEGYYAPDGEFLVVLSLTVPLPAQPLQTYWAVTYDLRDASESVCATESDRLTVVCRGVLADTVIASLHAGEPVRVEGRLVLTHLRWREHLTGDTVQLAEVLANAITPLQA